MPQYSDPAPVWSGFFLLRRKWLRLTMVWLTLREARKPTIGRSAKVASAARVCDSDKAGRARKQNPRRASEFLVERFAAGTE